MHDVLATEAGHRVWSDSRIESRHTHGTGCSLSAAIAALLAQAVPLAEAVERAKAYVWEGLQHGRNLHIGRGSGPIDHLFALHSKPPA